MRNAKTAMLNMHVTVTLDTPVMAIHVLILTNVLPVSHHVTSIQPVLTKREVTSEHVTQVLKAPDMLAMIFTSVKTNHVTQMATAKTLESFGCSCKNGFSDDKFNCVDINECNLGSHNCARKKG